MEQRSLTTKQFLELSGHKVYLRKLDMEHMEAYWTTLKESSIESMVFTGTQQIFNRTDIEGSFENVSKDASRIDFLIFAQERDELVGEVVISDMDRINRSAGLRIAINDKDNFSRGFGTEALILALNYGFGMYNLHRIELEVLAFNDRAIHTYEKVGFKREGIRRDASYYNHQYQDLITMSILEDEFWERHVKEPVLSI
ncbi:MAG TPA: GNAT family N-acetyltransferase [Clostridiaceae bacterium]|nr:GNAT family N-acetyltransferase [Clostridiaceae bacterium]